MPLVSPRELLRLFGRPWVAAQVVDSFPCAVHIAGYVSQRRGDVAEIVPYRSEVGVKVAIHGSGHADVDGCEYEDSESDEQAIDADGRHWSPSNGWFLTSCACH